MISALSIIVALAQATALLMSVAFITYVLLIVRPFLRDRPRPAGRAENLSWHFFVPALNEERVIGQTIDHLRAAFPGTDVWVIDDASDDHTAAIIGRRASVDPLVHLVPRRLPEARTGKGDALNAAYRTLSDWLPARTDRSRTIIGVVDADGRLAPNCLDVCAGRNLFGDTGVGSVQVLVRMLNRADRRSRPGRGRAVNFVGHVLNRLQDLEFRVPISAIQVTRRFTGTVGLGGNGQFSRLSALDMVADRSGRPWRGALLDDYELSLHLMLTGHRNAYTQDTYVDQEALPDIGRLLRQRTRWGQGTMQCGSYLRQLWTSDHVSRIGALEATYYLSQPWLQLIGTFVYPVPFVLLLAGYLAHPAAMASWALVGGWMAAAYYLTFGVGPFLLWGPLYRKRCEPDLTIAQALGLGFAYSCYVLMIYLTSWRALTRIVRGKREWFKTRRNAEFIGSSRPSAPAPDPRPAPRPAPVPRSAPAGIPALAEVMGDAQ
jgi:1,2-diacylglycerol 3-beta-glucosyltransferase